jgi:hypothetical protein
MRVRFQLCCTFTRSCRRRLWRGAFVPAASCGPSANPPTTSGRRGKLSATQSVIFMGHLYRKFARRDKHQRLDSGVFSRMRCSITGIKNASVLPVPVCAVASTSRPAIACGIVAACTGVGVTKLACNNRPFTYEEICNSEKLSTLCLFSGRNEWNAHTTSKAWTETSMSQFEFKLRRRFTERTAGGHCQIDSSTNRATQSLHQGLMQYITHSSQYCWNSCRSNFG